MDEFTTKFYKSLEQNFCEVSTEILKRTEGSQTFRMVCIFHDFPTIGLFSTGLSRKYKLQKMEADAPQT